MEKRKDIIKQALNWNCNLMIKHDYILVYNFPSEFSFRYFTNEYNGIPVIVKEVDKLYDNFEVYVEKLLNDTYDSDDLIIKGLLNCEYVYFNNIDYTTKYNIQTFDYEIYDKSNKLVDLCISKHETRMKFKNDKHEIYQGVFINLTSDINQ